jgi:tetratricopeptide (TPR) repeat protein
MHHVSYNFERGKRFFELGKYDLAVKEFSGLTLDPQSNIDYAYYYGLSLTRIGKYEEALFFLEQVVSARQSFLHEFQCRMILGYIYTVTGRYHLADYEFRKTLRSGMESRQIYSSLGHVSYRLKRLDDSIMYLKKSLNLDPEYPTALNSLGFIYAEEEIDKKKGFDLCRKAVTLKPDNPTYLDSLGWASYKLGDTGLAREFLKKALDLLPGNKEIKRHIQIALGS